MVNAVYDHIIAILIVGAIFIGTVVALPAMSFVSTQAIDQQQLRNTALNVLNTILLSTGSPADWGYTPEKIETFGLALSDECSLYVLDLNKVQRLDSENEKPVSYSRVRELLKLDGYGFSLALFRPFTINWALEVFTDRVMYAVSVTRNEDGMPIPNAKVKVITLVVANKENNVDDLIVLAHDPVTSFTDVLGKVQANVPITLEPGYNINQAIAIMEITVGGISTLAIARKDDSIAKFIKINVIGDDITLFFRDSEIKDNPAERRIIELDVFTLEELIKIFNVDQEKPPDIKITYGEGYEYRTMHVPGISMMNPAVGIFVLRVTIPSSQGGGQGGQSARRLVMVAGPLSLSDTNKVFSFGPERIPTDKIITKVRRFVVISGLTYVAELALWKE